MQMVFEVVSGKPQPRLPRLHGVELLPDGQRYLTPAQCAERFGQTESYWRDSWVSQWGDLVATQIPPTSAAAASPADESAAGDPAAAAASAVSSAAMKAAWDVIRVVRFPHLVNDAHWQYVVDDCAARGISPREIWVKLQRSDETGQLEPRVITLIQTFRKLAERTGKRGGETPPLFCGPDGMWAPGPWVKEKQPYAAQVIVIRRDTGEQFEGTAYWRLCADYRVGADGTPKLAEMWEKGGPHMLAKCAAADAYRKAFPTELGGLHTTDEMQIERRLRPGATGDPAGADEEADEPSPLNEVASVIAEPKGTATGDGPADIPDDPRLAAKYVDETTPELSRLPIELVYNDLAPTVDAAKRLIDDRRARWPRIFAAGDKTFCGAVIYWARSRQQPIAAA